MSETVEAVNLDLVVQEFNLGTLTTNAQEILAMVKEKVAGYKIENYSPDRIPEAKRDKADLNAAAARLNSARLEYERTWMKPFDEFKGIIAEACAEIKKASTAIDQLIKDVEQGERDEKRRLIERFWDTLEVKLFTLDQIFEPSWTNKTTKMAAVKDAITERVKKVNDDLAILDKIGEAEAKAHYLDTLDLNGAIAVADRIKANRDRLEAADKARREAEEKRAAAPVVAPPDPMPSPVEQPQEAPPAEPTPEPAPEPAPEDPVLEFTLHFWGPKSKLQALRTYIDELGIEFEKI